jgi:hypothetical protein
MLVLLLMGHHAHLQVRWDGLFWAVMVGAGTLSPGPRLQRRQDEAVVVQLLEVAPLGVEA